MLLKLKIHISIVKQSSYVTNFTTDNKTTNVISKFTYYNGNKATQNYLSFPLNLSDRQF